VRILFPPSFVVAVRIKTALCVLPGAGGAPGLLLRAVVVVEAVQKAIQLPGANRVLELAQSLGLDLTYARAGDPEDAAGLLERLRVVPSDSVALLDELALFGGHVGEDLLDSRPEFCLRLLAGGRFAWLDIAEDRLQQLLLGTLFVRLRHDSLL